MFLFPDLVAEGSANPDASSSILLCLSSHLNCAVFISGTSLGSVDCSIQWGVLSVLFSVECWLYYSVWSTDCIIQCGVLTVIFSVEYWLYYSVWSTDCNIQCGVLTVLLSVEWWHAEGHEILITDWRLHYYLTPVQRVQHSTVRATT